MEGGAARLSATAPRVTVAIAASNAEGFLSETLDSVLEQSYGHWQTVVADDASTDRTSAVAERYAEQHPERIRVVRLERVSGSAAARNAAIGASNGSELIALLDHDDCWRPDYLEHMVALYDDAVAAGRHVGIVACNAILQTPNGPVGTFADVCGWQDPVTYEGMIERSTIFAGALFPRVAFEEVGGFEPECWGADDYDLWLRIIERGYEVVLTREPLVIYRLHGNNLSRNQLRMSEAAIAAYRRALERGASTPRQRRAIRKRLRHYRALRFRALALEAIARRRRLDALRIAIRGVPAGTTAVLQDPRRWGEWSRDLARFPRRQPSDGLRNVSE